VTDVSRTKEKYHLSSAKFNQSIIYLPMSTIHEKKHNEYAIGKTYKAHRALTVALN